MKNPILALVLIASIALAPGCANMTPQQQQTAALAYNIAQTVQNAAAAYYGVPPGASKAVDLAENSIWGAYVQKTNGGQVDDGSVVASVNDALAAVIPANAKNAQVLAALQAAAASIKAKAPSTTVPTATRHLRTLYYGDRAIKGALIGGATIVYQQ